MRFTSKLPVFGLLLLTLLIFLQSCAFSSKSTRRLLKKAEGQQYDLIIVPGVPFENGSWSRIMKGRVYWAKYLYDRGIAKNVMFSGSAVYTPYYEAEIMGLYAAAIGIPSENIFAEKKAEHSTENVYYSYKLGKKMGFQRIALASDPFQSKLLRKFVRKRVSPEVALIPIVFDTLKLIEPSMIDPAIDSEKAFKKEFVPLPERESFWERFRGTRGLKVDKKVYEE